MKNIPRTLPESFWIYNPWWDEPALINKDLQLRELKHARFVYKHPLLEDFPFNKDCILTLRGPRQIGKSTLVKQIIKKIMIEKGVEGARVFFFSCDTVKDYKELDSILVRYLESARAITKKRLYIFLDEISFVEGWQRAVKSLYDMGSLRGCSLLVTGSSSVDLLFSAERLPGRRGKVLKPDIDFMPLSFKDFYSLTGGHKKAKKGLLDDYLLCGGFPAVINEYYTKGYITDYTFNTYLSWVEGDLHKLGKSSDLAFRIVARFFAHLSSSFSWYKVAKEAGIGSHATVIEYAEILEKMFVLFDVGSFLVSQKLPDPAKNRKVYFYDPFIFNVLAARTAGFSEQFFPYLSAEVVTLKNKPSLVENVVASHLKRLGGDLYTGKLARGEVDFVLKDKGKYSFFEVKYRESFSKSDFAGFQKEQPKESLTVISKKTAFSSSGIKAIALEDFLLL